MEFMNIQMGTSTLEIGQITSKKEKVNLYSQIVGKMQGIYTLETLNKANFMDLDIMFIKNLINHILVKDKFIFVFFYKKK